MGRRSAEPTAHPIIGEDALSFVLAPHPGGGQKEWISGEDLAIVDQGLALLALDAWPPIRDQVALASYAARAGAAGAVLSSMAIPRGRLAPM